MLIRERNNTVRKVIEIDENVLRDLYINQNLSCTSVSKIYNCDPTTIHNRLKQFNIPRKYFGGKGKRINIPYDIIYDLYIIKKISPDIIAKNYNCERSTIYEILKKYNITEQDKVNTYKLNKLQHDILIGSILGDGHISKVDNDHNYSSFTVGHTIKQVEYLKAKFEYFKEFCNYNEVKNDKNMYFYHFTTRYLPVFTDYKDISIKETVDKINDNSFVVWLLDDGHLNKSKAYSIGIKRFTLDEINYTRKILKEKLDLNSMYHYRNKEMGILGKLHFPVTETMKIFNIINNSNLNIIANKTMSYKLKTI